MNLKKINTKFPKKKKNGIPNLDQETLVLNLVGAYLIIPGDNKAILEELDSCDIGADHILVNNLVFIPIEYVNLPTKLDSPAKPGYIVNK